MQKHAEQTNDPRRLSIACYAMLNSNAQQHGALDVAAGYFTASHDAAQHSN